MKPVLKLSIFILVILLMVSCGSGNSDNENMTTGQFIDDPVQGLNYSCSSGWDGVTDSSGEYVCDEGDDVTFSIGIMSIGTIAAQSGIITPYSLFPNNIDAALNLARLLQSIDTDPNDGVIIFDQDLVALLPDIIDFSSEIFIRDVELDLGIALVSVEEAQNSLNASILVAGEVIPDGSHIPVADAGPDQNVITTDQVFLSGADSVDADDDQLEYQWSFIASPQGSTVTLSGITSSEPTFYPDVDGGYIIQLVVNDGIVDSAADTVIITAATGDAVPVADAGSDQNIDTTSVVSLDGSGSSDANVGDVLTYQWSITAAPTDSSAILSDVTAEAPVFTADKDGSYIVQLIVNDGTNNSVASTVTITASSLVSHNGLDYRTVESPYTKRIWLDRNVGASQLCTSITDLDCCGGYYQWGRNTDGHELPSSSLDTTLASSLNNVGPYLINPASAPSPNPLDWVNTQIDVDNSGSLRRANWLSTDGSSVCPIGYRVPTLVELENETALVNNPSSAYANFLKLPSGGSRPYTGSQIYYTTVTLWTSDIEDENIPTHSMYRHFSSYGATSGTMVRAKAYTIRCIQD